MALIDQVVHRIFDAVAGAKGGGGAAAGQGGGDEEGLVEVRRTCPIWVAYPSELTRHLPLLGARRRGGARRRRDSLAGRHQGAAPAADDGRRRLDRHRAPQHPRGRRDVRAARAPIGRLIVRTRAALAPFRYVASFHSVSAGAPLAIAIAIHNIPEV